MKSFMLVNYKLRGTSLKVNPIHYFHFESKEIGKRHFIKVGIKKNLGTNMPVKIDFKTKVEHETRIQ